MPIPTATDHKLGEIENLASLIMTQLRVLRYAGKARSTEGLREILQTYVNEVMALANELK